MAAEKLRKITDAVLELLYPPRCMFCDEITLRGAQGMACAECAASLRFVSINSADEDENHEDIVIYIDGAFAAFSYEGPVREAILRFKYEGMRDYAAGFAALLYGYLKTQGFAEVVESACCFVPVPLYAEKQKNRGYNQAEVLAGELSRLYGIPVCVNLLTRIKNTPQQSELTRERRIKNVKGAFCAEKSKDAASKVIILVDDIYTSGATLNECAGELKKAGARAVYAVTLARTPLKK